MKKPQRTIGWRERVSLPEWGIDGIRAKIDTGAKTSSIHARQITALEDGQARFEVVIRERPSRLVVEVTATSIRETVVKPKPGLRELRPVFRTRLRIGADEFDIDLNLVGRGGMLCRMLLGRTAIAGRYLVNPAKSFLLTNSKTGEPKGA
ncbi:MAG: hypothetical protein ACI9OJ_001368 [Myxococcota bacterium]|jgi:hypothetical protein